MQKVKIIKQSIPYWGYEYGKVNKNTDPNAAPKFERLQGVQKLELGKEYDYDFVLKVLGKNNYQYFLDSKNILQLFDAKDKKEEDKK